jgi:hypothetical protein
LAPRIAQIAHEEGYDGRVQISPMQRSRARIAASNGAAAVRTSEAAIEARPGCPDGAPFPQCGRALATEV